MLKKSSEIAFLQKQITQNSKEPCTVTKLQNQIAILKQKSVEELAKFNNYLVKNQTLLLATGLIGLTGALVLQSASISSLQDQIIQNSDLGRQTDEKMFQALDEKNKREKQEFDDKIQQLRQEMQDLKNKQTSTLLPQNSNKNPSEILNQNFKEFNPEIPYQNTPPITLPQISAKPLSNNLIPQKELIQPSIQVPAQSTPLKPTPQEN